MRLLLQEARLEYRRSKCAATSTGQLIHAQIGGILKKYGEREMSYLVIYNPAAGLGKSRPWVNRFVGILERRGHQVEMFFTAKPGDALQRARRVRSGTKAIIAAGGDGTVNEVINGLGGTPGVPILHVPTGTANELASSLGLPADPESLATILEQGAVRMIDVGAAGDRLFLLNASAGFDAMVVEEIHRNRRTTLGYRGYAIPILKTMARYRARDIFIEVDGRDRLSGALVMAHKVRTYGRLFVFADGARLDSGHFDVCVFDRGDVLALLGYAQAGLTRQSGALSTMTRLKATCIRLEAKVPIPVQVDGDFLGTTPVEITLLPARIPLVAPA